jgi:hypothetical protein
MSSNQRCPICGSPISIFRMRKSFVCRECGTTLQSNAGKVALISIVAATALSAIAILIISGYREMSNAPDIAKFIAIPLALIFYFVAISSGFAYIKPAHGTTTKENNEKSKTSDRRE